MIGCIMINASNRPLNVNATTDKPYTVNLWGSHPDENNDDCYTGVDFATNEDACVAFMATAHDADGSILDGNTAPGQSRRAYYANWAYVEIDGPDVYLVAKNPNYSAKRARQEDAESELVWKREAAMQAGMAFGCDGFNDEQGF